MGRTAASTGHPAACRRQGHVATPRDIGATPTHLSGLLQAANRVVDLLAIGPGEEQEGAALAKQQLDGGCTQGAKA